MENICGNLKEGHTCDRVKMYNQMKKNQEGDREICFCLLLQQVNIK